MKLILSSLLAVGIASTSLAFTIPVAQDTNSSSLTGKVAAANGRAVGLSVNLKQTSLIRFDLSDFDVVPDAISANNIQSAVLRLWVSSAKLPAAVTVHTITSGWTETFTGAAVPLPTITNVPLATIAPEELVPKRFVYVDVTTAVATALNSGSDFGFALKTTDPKTKVVFASKEGAAAGYVAELEIVANTALDSASNISANDGNFLGKLTLSTAFVVEARPNSTGFFNNFIGTGAGAANTTGLNNTFLGHATGFTNTTGGANTFLGSGAGNNNVTGSSNTFVGSGAGQMNGASQNVFVGAGAGQSNTSGGSNVFVGYNAGLSNVTGNQNSFFGINAGKANVANFNTFVGAGAGENNSGGTANVFMGNIAGLNNTSGSNNTFIGAGAGSNHISGTQNSLFGTNAGNVTTGDFNSFFGAASGQQTTTGSRNVASGKSAGVNNTSGSNNVFIGTFAGVSNTAEDNNTFIGDAANGASGITNSTAIGKSASVTASNSIVLGNNCNVGIRTSAPNSVLQVNGSLSLPVRTANNQLLTGLGDNDYVLFVTGTLATSVVLPQPGAAGRIYVVKNHSTQVVTITFQAAGPTIDGNANLQLAGNARVTLICDGTNWFTIN